MRRLHHLVRSRAALVALVAAVAAPAAAQSTPSAVPATPPATGPIEVDRVVAIVGDQPILYSELRDEVLTRRAQGLEVPTDSAALAKLEASVLSEMIDAELLVQKAKEEKVEVSDDDLERTIDRRMADIRSRFSGEAEFRSELKKAGFGTPEDYRKKQLDILRRQQLQQEVFRKLKQEGKLSPAPVSEGEVTEAYQQSKATLPKREARISFKQIVVAPKPTPAAKAAARAKAESLLVEISKGGDFEQIAKRESMDPGSKAQGGDLGWFRRGVMLRPFEDMAFALPVGRVSPIVETAYGFHIIRVDRAQPSEVKARHILIRPKIDSADVVRAKLEADSVRAALDKGANFDSLVTKHHDPIENVVLPDLPRDSVPAAYSQAIGTQGANAIVGPFALPDLTNNLTKYVVLRVTAATPAGDYPEDEARQVLRQQIGEAKTARRLLDSLRKQTYVAIKL
ncbi:SurA domain-containing protein [Gemmatirosa kalamazoonensis]|uniref:SurA domain-containing protein n=1 Tax=Gemmatirosa kalamazoonensis TaxID=861299 RepID=W0RLH0_9BACT|nr:peptidylprolyl isomerase [Gemmatirosa kalamazoonensis]AHG91282.1 SurA domain-containing protein [Gemmatirosa kalamazoonensis]